MIATMTLSTTLAYTAMGFFAIAIVAAIAGAVRSGAMRNDESPKYRMLEDEGGTDVREK